MAQKNWWYFLCYFHLLYSNSSARCIVPGKPCPLWAHYLLKCYWILRKYSSLSMKAKQVTLILLLSTTCETNMNQTFPKTCHSLSGTISFILNIKAHFLTSTVFIIPSSWFHSLDGTKSIFQEIRISAFHIHPSQVLRHASATLVATVLTQWLLAWGTLAKP